MGKLIVWNVVSLDGFFEGPQPWDLRLHEHIWGADLEALSLRIGDEVGLLVFGRRTYQGMEQHWAAVPPDEAEVAAYMNAVPKLVGSRTLREATWNNTEVTSDIVAEVARRKQAEERPIYVFGSAQVVDVLLRAGLVDELMVGTAPVLLGGGTPLFKPAVEARPLTLIESCTTETGGVVSRYAVPPSEPGQA